MLKTSIFLSLSAVFLSSLAHGAFKSAALPENIASQVIVDYVALVQKSYGETVQKAKDLQQSLQKFTASPSEITLQQAKVSWKQARDAYSLTEAFRFYGGPIDMPEKGVETLVNSWPVDEVYMDYVKGKPDAGIIQNPKDYKEITKDLLTSLNQKDGERNVSTGYHPIEFLLWGQDEVGKIGGQRPITDYTTQTFADRRKKMLVLLGDLLVEHLEKVQKEWEPGSGYAKTFLALPKGEALQKIMLGMTTLSADEMAGERMTVALEMKSTENEQDCFSDYTLTDLASNQVGILKIYQTEGGAGLERIVTALDKRLAKDIGIQMRKTLDAIKKIPEPFDEVILGKKGARATAAAKAVPESLRRQAQLLAKAASAYGLELNVQSEDK